tara:strand:- start:2736 stop:4112 length:1377 start_codon:yes stop_codon:yes gene_type:complete
MAAQFELIPSTSNFQSTAEPLIIQVSESVVDTYFKYRFILVIKDRSGTQLAKLKTHMLSASNQVAVFDISRVLDDYIGPNIVNGNSPAGTVLTLGRTGFSPANIVSESYEQFPARQFELELGHEEAASPTGEPSETLNEASTTLFAFRDEFINYGDAYARGDGSFQPSSSADNFLSSAPNLGTESKFGSAWGEVREHRIGTAQGSVMAYGAEGSTAQYLLIRGFESDGTIIATANLDLDAVGGDTTPTTDAQAVQYIGVGPLNLQQHASAASNTDLTTLITDADLAYYELYLSSTSTVIQANQKSVVHRFTIDEGCTNYPRKQLMFLNRHGGWDCFNFDQKSEERLTGIERSNYNRPRGNWDAVTTTTDWTYHAWERGVTTTTVKAEKQIRVSTDYVEEGYVDHLRDIAVSRAVFLVDGSSLIPVVVTDSEYLFKTTANDKLISYSFTLRFSNRPRLK